MKTKAIRQGDNFIEIDQKKGEWPYFRAQADDDFITLFIDSNKGGQLVGEGQGMALIHISHKKARALRDFLDAAGPE